MKKVLSLVLVLFMLVTCIPVGAVNTSAYEQYGDYSWRWSDSDVFCYVGDTGVTETNVVIEYDVYANYGSEGLAWSLVTGTDSESKKELIFDGAESMVYIGNDYSSSDFDAEGSCFGLFAVGDDEWNHVKYTFDNGKVTVSINGFDAASAEGIAAPVGSYYVNIYSGYLNVDNWKISDLEGNVLYFENFEGLGDTCFSMGFGTKMENYIHRGRRFQSEGAYLNGEYCIPGVDLGQSQVWNFDLWLEDENATISIVADGGDTRYTVGYDFLGVTVAGDGSGYSETEIISTEWSEDGVGLETAGWCSVEIKLNVNGKDTIRTDIFAAGHALYKSFEWEGSSVSKEYSDNCIIIDTVNSELGTSTGVVIDDLFIKGNKGYGPYEFEYGDKEIFELAENSDECEIRWVKVLNEGCLHKCEHIRHNAKEATCTEYGATGTLICADCTHTFEMSMIIPKLPHEESDWLVVEEAGHFNDGVRVKECLTCGKETARETLPMSKDDLGLNANNAGGIIEGVPSNVTAEQFVLRYKNMGMEVSVIDAEGNTPRYIGTGCKVTFEGNEYTVSVKGDLTGDGLISAKDLVRIKKAIIGTDSFEGVHFESADMDGNGKFNAKDSLYIRKALKNS